MLKLRTWDILCIIYTLKYIIQNYNNYNNYNLSSHYYSSDSI